MQIIINTNVLSFDNLFPEDSYMFFKNLILTILAAALSFGCSSITRADAVFPLKELAIQATSESPNEAESAIKKLRETGAEGLQTLFETYAVEIENYKKTGESTEKWQKIAYALDSVAMQKDVYASQLYWFTDLEKAKEESAKANKPILSLHMLGNLNEEFSCANSRFFRSILYPNANISKFLQENYVLHWKSVRPVPKITIDFGDGRKIERTITGNSIHYILDKNGKIINALSGLNNPQVFYGFIYGGNDLAKRLSLSKDENNSPLARFRANQYQTLTGQIEQSAKQLKLKFDTSQKSSRDFEEMPTAILAMNVAMTKSLVEMPVLKSLTADMTKYGEEQVNLENWKLIAKLNKKEAKLDENSIAFIRRQTAKNNLSEAEFKQLIAKLEEYISVDTARNEYLLRPTLLVWMAKGEDANLAKFNEKVYAKLFLTPSADKWLGLYASDIYTALDGNGIQ